MAPKEVRPRHFTTSTPHLDPHTSPEEVEDALKEEEGEEEKE